MFITALQWGQSLQGLNEWEKGHRIQSQCQVLLSPVTKCSKIPVQCVDNEEMMLLPFWQRRQVGNCSYPPQVERSGRCMLMSTSCSCTRPALTSLFYLGNCVQPILLCPGLDVGNAAIRGRPYTEPFWECHTRGSPRFCMWDIKHTEHFQTSKASYKWPSASVVLHAAQCRLIEERGSRQSLLMYACQAVLGLKSLQYLLFHKWCSLMTWCL